VAQLPHELQQLLHQVAAYYSLPPQRLHEAALVELASHEQGRKRPRIVTGNPMSPEHDNTFSGSSLAQHLLDKPPSTGQNSSSGKLLLGSLTQFICQQCLRLCDSEGMVQSRSCFLLLVVCQGQLTMFTRLPSHSRGR